MFYLELTINDVMTIKRKKHLFWYIIDKTIKIAKFRVCDCFNSILKLKKKNEHIDGETIKEIFFEELAMTVDIEDVFLLFGKVCIVYCLYSLTSNTEDLFCMKSYIRIVWHIILNAIVCIFWKKIFLVSMHYVQIVSIIFLKWFLRDLLK